MFFWEESAMVSSMASSHVFAGVGGYYGGNQGNLAGVFRRDALARVGLAGSFFECLAGSRWFGPFAIGTIWGESGSEESDAFARHGRA